MGKQELALAALLLILALNIAFFPAIWGGKTLMSSAMDASSITLHGAIAQPQPRYFYPPKVNDPGGVGWFPEPGYAFVHNEIFDDRVLPLWNPYNACGAPWLANMQSQVLNPLQVIAWLSPSPSSADAYVLARLFCAGILTFLFLRQFVGMWASLFGAIAYMQGGYLMLYLGMPDISVCAYVPGLFWRLERLLRSPDFNSIVLVALFTTLTIFGGMPEVTFLALLLGAIYFVMRVVVERTDWKSVRTPIARYLAASIAGIMMGAPQIFPFLEYIRESFNAHMGRSPGMVAQSNFALHMLTYFNPLIYGPLNKPGVTANVHFSGVTGYWGTITFFLALLGATTSVKRLIDKRTDGRRSIDLIAVFCLTFSVVMVAKRFGFPLVNWVGMLPVLKLIVFYKYDEPFIGFFVATLAAIGLNWIATRAVSAKSVLTCFAAFALCYMTLLIVDSHSATFLKPYWRAGAASIAIAFAVCFLSFLGARNPRGFHRLAPLLVAAVFAELTLSFIVPEYYKFNVFAPASANPYNGAPFVTYLLSHDKGWERVFGYDALLRPNWSSVFSLCDTRDEDAMYPRRYLHFVRSMIDDNKPVDHLSDDNLSTRFVGTEPALCADDAAVQRFFQITSTRFVLSKVPHNESAHDERTLRNFDVDGLPHGTTVATFADTQINRIDNILPRAALFYDVALCVNKEAALALTADAKTNLFKTVAIERSELDVSTTHQASALHNAVASADKSDIVAYQPMRVTISTKSDKPGFLMLNDTMYPGWNAYIDGSKTKLLHADYLFRGVFVPAGTHTLEFKYQPHWFYLGLLTAAGGMLLLGLWGTGLPRKQKAP
ncbi:MAG TPA: YfhO family protein [Planktothrix sp.]|jgi:hypothetical protein